MLDLIIKVREGQCCSIEELHHLMKATVITFRETVISNSTTPNRPSQYCRKCRFYVNSEEIDEHYVSDGHRSSAHRSVPRSRGSYAGPSLELHAVDDAFDASISSVSVSRSEAASIELEMLEKSRRAITLVDEAPSSTTADHSGTLHIFYSSRRKCSLIVRISHKFGDVSSLQPVPFGSSLRPGSCRWMDDFFEVFAICRCIRALADSRKLQEIENYSWECAYYVSQTRIVSIVSTLNSFVFLSCSIRAGLRGESWNRHRSISYTSP